MAKVETKVAPAPAGGSAKVVSQNDRAPEGFKRYRIRIDGPFSDRHALRYILAQNKEKAEAEYLKVERVEKVDPSQKLVVIELPD